MACVAGAECSTFPKGQALMYILARSLWLPIEARDTGTYLNQGNGWRGAVRGSLLELGDTRGEALSSSVCSHSGAGQKGESHLCSVD
jgi:hypothetical protein